MFECAPLVVCVCNRWLACGCADATTTNNLWCWCNCWLARGCADATTKNDLWCCWCPPTLSSTRGAKSKSGFSCKFGSKLRDLRCKGAMTPVAGSSEDFAVELVSDRPQRQGMVVVVLMMTARVEWLAAVPKQDPPGLKHVTPRVRAYPQLRRTASATDI